MGARFPFRKRTRGWKARTWVIRWLICYGIIWTALAVFVVPPGTSEPKLVSLLGWGGIYFAAAIYIAHTATARIIETVKEEILPPHTTEAYLKAVAADLRKRCPRRWSLAIPLPIAAGALEAAWWAVSRDMGRPWQPLGWLHSWESRFWGFSYLGYFYTAGVVVIAARFYSSFARKLELEKPAFYVLGAAETPLVKTLSKLDSQVLAFWMMIGALILTSMALAVLPGAYRLGWDSWLLTLLVPTTGFFAAIFGGLVFALAERRIRGTLRRFTADQAGLLLQEGNAIVRSNPVLSPADKDRVDRLMALRDEILAGGRYGNRVEAGFSMAAPAAASVLSLVASFTG